MNEPLAWELVTIKKSCPEEGKVVWRLFNIPPWLLTAYRRMRKDGVTRHDANFFLIGASLYHNAIVRERARDE